MLLPDRFSVGTLTDQDGQTVVRFRAKIPGEIRAALPRQFVVEWSFSLAHGAAAPSAQQLDESEAFGSALCNAIEAHDDALLAFVATGNGAREWYFYCKEPVSLQARLNAVISGDAFPITLHAGHDPSWRAYSEFTSPFEGGV